MSMRTIRVCSAWLLIFAVATRADDSLPTDVTEKQNIDAALKLTRESATKYEMSLAVSGVEFKLREQPILRWSNPEQGQIYGNVFLWTNRGRPEVVGSLFKWFSPFTHMSHEFHSLSAGEIRGRYDDVNVWQTSEAGVTFQRVPEAPAVAATPSGRLAQMRQMARQFSARSTNREGLKLELRLLAQPVYRYELEPQAGDVLDGALFVFVQGTDPELWLLLETHRSADGGEWRYALARMNSIAFDVDHNGRSVWRRDVLPWGEISGHKATYTSFLFKQPEK